MLPGRYALWRGYSFLATIDNNSPCDKLADAMSDDREILLVVVVEYAESQLPLVAGLETLREGVDVVGL